MKKKITLIFVFFYLSINAQNNPEQLEKITITTNRITLPFSKTSRTITIISAVEIKKSSATNVADLLQNVAGVDVRRRGVDGMQSDLYIRGGNFDQVLLLIDGVKMDDAQTGHHAMNAIIPIETIERIEILKGAAARIYGQSAFTGAVNIITKKVLNSALNLGVNYGSFNNKKLATIFSKKYKEASVLASVNFQKSDGYRFNTDFSTITALVKARVKEYDFISTFTERKFGANGFYASPNFKDQYEETQTSLFAVSRQFKHNSLEIKPRIYWRRNQDMYLFLRHNPSYYRNLHISNKVGVEVNTVYTSNLGKTGFGVDVSRVFLVSNNLGNHQRTTVTGFLEHRFEILNSNFDITPGVAISYYSDFKTTVFPGLDLGYRFSDAFKMYGNIGYTYRIPTFTDLFYVGPTTLGNANLAPESALTEEIGLKYKGADFNFSATVFYRTSDNLIDWTKDNIADKWQARNFSKVITKGFETSIMYNFEVKNLDQKIKIAYHFIDDDIKDNNTQFTRYSLNSLKHQLVTNLDITYNSILRQQISHRFVERTNGESYQVMDTKLLLTTKNNFSYFITINNIFNTIYTETNLVPMPESNLLLGFKYQID